jgi:hypothetical protein
MHSCCLNISFLPRSFILLRVSFKLTELRLKGSKLGLLPTTIFSSLLLEISCLRVTALHSAGFMS